MATISNQDGSCKTRVCLVDGKWVPHGEIIAKASERILGLLSTGPKTRRYIGGSIRVDAKFIDHALRTLANAGRVAASSGEVLNRRTGKTWTITG